MEYLAGYILRNKYTKFASVVFLGILSLLFAHFISQGGVVIGVILIVLILSVFVFILTISDFRTGFVLLITYSFFLFQIARMLPIPLAMGVFVEVFLIIIFLGIFVQSLKGGTSSWSVFKNPIGYAILVMVGYVFLEFLNPNSTSISAKILGIRNSISFALTFYVAMHVFTSFKITIRFTQFWLFLALIVALYGMKQEFIGFSDSEWAYINSDPGFKRMMFIAGKWRKYSFLSDVTSYGLFSSYAGMICMIIAIGPYSLRNRVLAGTLSLICIYAGSFSGTRTAWAMIILGLALYFLMNMNDKRILLFACVVTMMFLVIIFGPFYSGTLSRVRTTFRPGEDASMEVRDLKRIRLQPYIHAHPIGGGINTAGNDGMRFEPGHPLAGRYDPDSGYLRTALEMGWIGLFIQLALYFVVMYVGVQNYYSVKNPKIRFLLGAYLCAFFSLTIANFTQDSLDQKPLNLLVISSFAIMIRLKDFDTDLSNNKLNS